VIPQGSGAWVHRRIINAGLANMAAKSIARGGISRRTSDGRNVSFMTDSLVALVIGATQQRQGSQREFRRSFSRQGTDCLRARHRHEQRQIAKFAAIHSSRRRDRTPRRFSFGQLAEVTDRSHDPLGQPLAERVAPGGLQQKGPQTRNAPIRSRTSAKARLPDAGPRVL
jgi:hypothetical protein